MKSLYNLFAGKIRGKIFAAILIVLMCSVLTVGIFSHSILMRAFTGHTYRELYSVADTVNTLIPDSGSYYVENGDYSLYVKVEDWAGNVVEQEYPNYYQLDKTPPSCTLSYVSGANVAGHGLTVSLKCNDNYNLAQCGTTISGGENQTSASLTLTGQTSSITRYVKDIAGNNSSCSISISASTCKTSCCGTRKCHCDSEGKNCSRCNKTCTSGKCCGYHVG